MAAQLYSRALGLDVLAGSLWQPDKGKEKYYEAQNDGSGGIGRGVCCWHGGGDRVGLGAAGAGAAAQSQQVTVQRVISPTVTDEDIALLRQDLRARKMQVIGQNMSLSEEEGQKFWPIYNHYVRDLQEVNNRKYALLKQYAEMWTTMTDQHALIYVRNWLEADGQAQALRWKYVPA